MEDWIYPNNMNKQELKKAENLVLESLKLTQKAKQELSKVIFESKNARSFENLDKLKMSDYNEVVRLFKTITTSRRVADILLDTVIYHHLSPLKRQYRGSSNAPS